MGSLKIQEALTRGEFSFGSLLALYIPKTSHPRNEQAGSWKRLPRGEFVMQRQLAASGLPKNEAPKSLPAVSLCFSLV